MSHREQEGGHGHGHGHEGPPRGSVQAAQVTCVCTCLEEEGPGPSPQPGARHPRMAGWRCPLRATSRSRLVEEPAFHGARVTGLASRSAALRGEAPVTLLPGRPGPEPRGPGTRQRGSHSPGRSQGEASACGLGQSGLRGARPLRLALRIRGPRRAALGRFRTLAAW